MQFSHQPKRRKTTIAVCLPDDCWEHVFKFLNNGDDDCYLKSLSVVSKQFLSITNRLLFSLTFNYQCPFSFKKKKNYQCPFLRRLLLRFTNLTSLNLERYDNNALDTLLHQISRFPLNLSSLNFSTQPTIPAAGLRAFSQNIKTLTKLTCSKINSINSNDLFLIAECFPLLEELDLSYPQKVNNLLNGVETLSSTLSKLTKINLSGHYYINDTSLFNLFKNCKLLQEVTMFGCNGITKAGIASALCERPTLRSLSFTNYFESEKFAMLDELVRNFPSLSEIKMEYPFDEKNTFVEENSIEDSNSLMNFVVSPQLKSLGLACNSWLVDKNIKMFASIFPNLQLLDLYLCDNISEDGILHVLKGCGNIRHLNLALGQVTLTGLNFEVPNLEVLDLSYTYVDDDTLHIISKNCRGLLQLLLKRCPRITEKGVMHVVENCTHLREINLQNCYQVRADIVDDMVFSRPSLRKIAAPPDFHLSCKKRELFSRYGCLIC